MMHGDGLEGQGKTVEGCGFAQFPLFGVARRAARGLESRLDLHLEPVTHPRRERRAGEAPRRVANVGDVTFRF